MTTESPVKEKTFQDHISDYKLLSEEKIQLFKNKESLELKVNEAKNESGKLEKKRIDLESFLANAGTLLLENKATTSDFLTKRQEHFCLLGALDDQKALEEICTAKLKDWPVSWRELRERMQQKERELRNVRLQILARDVAKQSSKQLKEILAHVESLENHNFVTNNLGNREVNCLSLGSLLVSAIYGGDIDNPGYPARDKQELVRQEFYKATAL